MKGWAKYLSSKSQKELKEVEASINVFCQHYEDGTFFDVEYMALKGMGGLNKDMFDKEEIISWSIKNKALQIKEDDNNSKLFTNIIIIGTICKLGDSTP